MKDFGIISLISREIRTKILTDISKGKGKEWRLGKAHLLQGRVSLGFLPAPGGKKSVGQEVSEHRRGEMISGLFKPSRRKEAMKVGIEKGGGILHLSWKRKAGQNSS